MVPNFILQQAVLQYKMLKIKNTIAIWQRPLIMLIVTKNTNIHIKIILYSSGVFSFFAY